MKALSADRTITGKSRFPTAVEPAKVGEYPALVRSGGGFFYDKVLEYRVWFYPEEGAKPLLGTHDYFFAFAEYETALAVSQRTKGAQKPLVLVRQYEWINEPSPGEYEVKKGERTTEWKIVWLKDKKRKQGSISEFLASRRPSRKSPV